MATQTEITVGNSPELVENYNNTINELTAYKTDYEKVSQLVDAMLKAGNIADMPLEKKKILQKAMLTKKEQREKITQLQQEADQMLQDMNTDYGEIKVQDVIYSGVKVTIGDTVMHVSDDIKYCTLRSRNGKIVVAPF
jgi:hypothetical protein